ncbi:membrane protein [Streptomyces fumanus]|uniref:Membrane protein n=2 Tax=Streptomyces fumanus TaxID=67302 RepID=A0A919A3Y8_9ACTN|nr:membrane protein [Streptomyces fumanus]
MERMERTNERTNGERDGETEPGRGGTAGGDGAAGAGAGAAAAAGVGKGADLGGEGRTEPAAGGPAGDTADGPAGRAARPAAPVNRAMTAFSPADEEKRRGVRRMKLTATGLLLFVALVYALAEWAAHRGAGAWAGYVSAAAEAGMVGALADWFAVTALFRHPLGLPIPHTAIIPKKKDQLGVSLGEFVGENFLSEDVVRQRLRAVGIGSRLGAWLAVPDHADRVTAELSAALRGALTVLRDSDVQAVVGEAITRRADAQEIGPGVGKMLEKVVADGGHRRAVDLVVTRAHDWLVTHGDSVMDAVQGGAPGWTPRFVDKRVGERVYKELLRFVTEMRDMPAHPARGALDRFLADFASDLQSDTDTRARVERLKTEVLGRGEVQDLIASAWTAVRSMIVSAAEDERSELRLRVRASLLSLGARMASDTKVQNKVDHWVEGAAVYVVTTYRREITSLITDTVAGWDAEHTTKKIEANIGRDLQFIRINGTVVGSLAGLLIYTVSRILGA